MFLLLTQHLACPTFTPVVMRSCDHAVMRSCGHAVMRSWPRAVLVCSTARCRGEKARSLLRIPSVIPGGLPKRQSRVRRRPTAARVGYSPSRDPSAAWPKSIRRPPYCCFFSRVRLLRHTDLLDRLGNGLASSHLDFDTRSLGMICSASSFFPRGMECPPLVLTPPDYRSGSGAV